MAIDTSERGLERPICAARTGAGDPTSHDLEAAFEETAA